MDRLIHKVVIVRTMISPAWGTKWKIHLVYRAIYSIYIIFRECENPVNWQEHNPLQQRHSTKGFTVTDDVKKGFGLYIIIALRYRPCNST
jgi:hypothetical protein